MQICGYADRFGVRPGETIRFYVNCDGPETYRAEIVEMIHGDTNPRGPGFIERPLPAAVDGLYPGRAQAVHSGSYGVVPFFSALESRSFTLQCWIWPTMPVTDPSYWRHGEQTILARGAAGQGFALFLDTQGRLSFRINDEVLTAPHPLRDHAWHFVAASFDADTGEAHLYHEPELSYALDPAPTPLRATFTGPAKCGPLPLMIAAQTAAHAQGVITDERFPTAVRGTAFFNGRIEAPTLCGRALTRLEIERMKQGGATNASERRFAGPPRGAGEGHHRLLEFFPWDRQHGDSG
jgi:N,N-dimethylformamidase